MKMLYVYNNKKRKTPLIKTPDTKEARELYKSRGYKIESHEIEDIIYQTMNPIQNELRRKEMKKNDSRTLD